MTVFPRPHTGRSVFHRVQQPIDFLHNQVLRVSFPPRIGFSALQDEGGPVMELQGVEGMPDTTFRRLTGIRKRTFLEMVAVLQHAEAHRKARGGKPNHLAVSVRLLMTLECWRDTARISTLGTATESARVRPIATSAGARIRSSRAGRSRCQVRRPSSGVTGLTRLSSSTRRKRPWNDLKKTAPLLVGQEKTPHAEDPARRRQGDGEDYMPRARRRPAA